VGRLPHPYSSLFLDDDFDRNLGAVDFLPAVLNVLQDKAALLIDPEPCTSSFSFTRTKPH
jgi:hypothetical protein